MSVLDFGTILEIRAGVTLKRETENEFEIKK